MARGQGQSPTAQVGLLSPPAGSVTAQQGTAGDKGPFLGTLSASFLYHFPTADLRHRLMKELTQGHTAEDRLS